MTIILADIVENSAYALIRSRSGVADIRYHNFVILCRIDAQ